MKKLMLVLLLLCGSAFAQYITVTASSCIGDGSGALLASGTMTIVGTDQNDNPIPYRAGSAQQSITAPIVRTITTGSLATSLQLASPLTSNPLNIRYMFIIKDNASKRTTVYKQVAVLANDTTNFNFCKMDSGLALPGVLTLVGATGPAGPTGPAAASITTAGQGVVWLPTISIPPGTSTSINFPSANVVYVIQVFLPMDITVRGMGIAVTAVASSTAATCGLYTIDGNTLLVSGGGSTTGSGGIRSTTFSAVSIPAGTYWYACTSNSTSTAFQGISIAGVGALVGGLGIGPGTIGTGANASSAGNLPSTLGAITNTTVSTFPVPIAIIKP